MITQRNDQKAKTARQLTATVSPLAGENYVRNTNMNWADELINLYDSTDKYDNRDNAIISILGEVRDKQAASELKFLLDHVDNNVRKEFVERFFVHDVSKDASCMKVKVRWAGFTEVNKTNNGRIRISLNKNGIETPVYFHRRPSTILYLIYLLEAYKSEKATMLDIANYEKPFCALFHKVFAYDGGLAYFKTLMGKGNSEQELLRHSLGDIRNVIGEACGLFHEDASPYILSKRPSYLNIQKKSIEIDERLLNIY